MKKQFYGINFPLTKESDKLTYLDLNESKTESIKSMLLHLILTPKGRRLRNPNFGTNLINYIFEPNIEETWEDIINEIKQQVSIYIPEVIFDNIEIQHDPEEENSVYIEISYSFEMNGENIKNKALVKL